MLLLFTQCKEKDTLDTQLSQNEINFIGPGSGCASFFVYKLNENKTLGLTIEGVRDALELNQNIKTFDVATQNHLTVKVEHLSNGNNFYCDDVIELNEEVLNYYTGYQGTVNVQIVEDSIDFDASALNLEVLYKVNIQLENIQLRDADGEELSIQSEEFTDVLVGWFPG